MYIGPWQEYNLSKAANAAGAGATLSSSQRPTPRRPLQQNNKGAGLSKTDVERALIATLDPQVAEKALAALFPLLENAAAVGAPNLTRRDIRKSPLPSLADTNKGSYNSYGDSPSSYRTSVSEPTRLKLKHHMSQDPLTARRPDGHNGLAASKREQKNALPQLNLHSRPGSGMLVDDSAVVSGSSSFPISTIAKPKRKLVSPTMPLGDYNPSEVLAVLKLDKNNQKPKFSQFWSWNDGSGTDGIAAEKSSRSEKFVTGTEKKLQQLQQMKAMYSTKPEPSRMNGAVVNTSAGNSTTSTLSQSKPSGNIMIPTSPIRKRQEYVEMPTTPIIADKDLTEVDIALISKYFAGKQLDFTGRSSDAPAVSRTLTNAGKQAAGGAGFNSGLRPTDSILTSPVRLVENENYRHGIGAQQNPFREAVVGKAETRDERSLFGTNNSLNHGYSGQSGSRASQHGYPISPLRADVSSSHRSVVGSGGIDDFAAGGGFDNLLDWSKNLCIDDF
jgi:hypothetical protein